jgi:hypothetical protein
MMLYVFPAVHFFCSEMCVFWCTDEWLVSDFFVIDTEWGMTYNEDCVYGKVWNLKSRA